jgi:hypothetical protein
LIGFQRIRALAIDTLERAPPFAAGWQRQDQESPATGAHRSFSLAHAIILPPVPKFVNSKFKLGHCQIQIRPLWVKTGQHPKSYSAPQYKPARGIVRRPLGSK